MHGENDGMWRLCGDRSTHLHVHTNMSQQTKPVIRGKVHTQSKQQTGATAFWVK